jgi:hypothetical protein
MAAGGVWAVSRWLFELACGAARRRARVNARARAARVRAARKWAGGGAPCELVAAQARGARAPRHGAADLPHPSEWRATRKDARTTAPAPRSTFVMRTSCGFCTRHARRERPTAAAPLPAVLVEWLAADGLPL